MINQTHSRVVPGTPARHFAVGGLVGAGPPGEAKGEEEASGAGAEGEERQEGEEAAEAAKAEAEEGQEVICFLNKQRAK